MSSTAQPTKTIEIFFFYHNYDISFRVGFYMHLSRLKGQGLIASWHEHQIMPGEEWNSEIDAHFNTAQIILLLISPDFLTSEYCNSVVILRAIERHNSGVARTIPIILRPVNLENTQLGKLQALPTDGKPVTSWSNRNNAFLDIVKGIRKAIEEFNQSTLNETRIAQEIDIHAPYEAKVASAIKIQSPRPLRIFLCHSSGDKPIVRELYKRLKKVEGIAPWFDEEDLLPGQDWQQEIRNAVRNCDIVIVCLSRSSINKVGYVQKEIKFALDVAEEQPEGTIFLIPLRLEECDTPDRLTHLHWVNYFEERGFDKLMKAVEVRARSII
jgi:hypothetical protein